MCERLDQIKLELKQVLDRHGVSICFDADDGSDWYGMSGERMEIVDDKTGNVLVNVSGTSLDGSDL